MKPSEELASRLYLAYMSLKTRDGSVTCARGNDPPDFVFTCGGDKHAVEVTELHQYLDVGGEEQSRTHWDAAVAAICERCEGELGQQLDRTIIVEISAPIAQGELQSLPREILSYARRGEVREETLFGRDDCSLKSLPDSAPRIIPFSIPAAHSTVPGSQTISANIQARTDYALNRIMEAKLPALQALKGFQEKVLIIYLTDPQCSAENVRRWLHGRKGVPGELPQMFVVYPFYHFSLGDSHEPALKKVS